MNTFKNPNLNGPRFRTKRISVLTADCLKRFKKKYPEYSDLTLKDFKNVVMTFNENITKGIIENRNGVELPEGLGYIFMGTCPPSKKTNINYKQSVDTGVKSNFRNWDSDNKLLKIFYTNRNSKYPFANKQVWSFKAVKQFRKLASDSFKENWAKYIEVAPTEKISAKFDTYRKKERYRNYKQVIPDDYNEFKL
jgi:hypothetical protein|eukprot:SAG31_NODE_246_length_19203_cov_19.662008_10_plen_194_part_00